MQASFQDNDQGGDEGDPDIDADWGEPGLTPGERVIAWNTLEVLAYRTGNPDHPVNAIPPAARAAMHLRFVVGTDVARLREQPGENPDQINLEEAIHQMERFQQIHIEAP